MDDGSDEAFDLFSVDGDGNLMVPKRTGKFHPKPIKAEVLDEPSIPSPSSYSLKSVPHSVHVQEQLAKEKVPMDLVEEEGRGNVMVVDGSMVEKGVGPMDVVMGEEEEEDQVVQEIDVFLNHSLLEEHMQLYVMQYPLRPCWRPYDLNEMCEEVKVKPDQMKVEFDLALDKNGCYDDEVDENLAPNVQTLCSSKVPLATDYAVGVMKQNELHLNPIRAIMQLRPSIGCSKFGKMQKPKNDDDMVESSIKGNHVNVEGTSGESSSEAWVRLKFCPTEHSSSTINRQKLITKEDDRIQFDMKPYDYFDSLPLLKLYNSEETSYPPKRVLLSKSLDERMQILFVKGPQIHQFDAVRHFVPDVSMDEFLKLLLQYADLLQGLWVTKSSLLCQGPEVIARDFILLLFSKCSVIPFEDLKRIKPDVQNRIMSPLAKRKPLLKYWKLIKPTDHSFIQRHPNIVKQQEIVWASRERDIMNALGGFSKSIHKFSKEHPRLSSCNEMLDTGNINHGASKMNLDERQGAKAFSDEARDVVPKVVVKVLRTHKVCSLSMINQKLQELALAESTVPKVDCRTSISAALESSKPLLKDMICQVATPIHDVYVLKSVGNQTLDPFRSIVIDLYRGKEHKAKLKKAEIIAAAKMVLKRDISSQEYTQVMSELCVSHRGCWILKRGDGNPD